ncbi:MAG: endonuclease III, partial [Pseudomonadota bacterium]
EWIPVSHLLIFHGRYVCKARKPLCEKCSLQTYCDYFQNQLPLKK